MFFSTLNLIDDKNRRVLEVFESLTEMNLQKIHDEMIKKDINSLVIHYSKQGILDLSKLATLPPVQEGLSLICDKLVYTGNNDEYFNKVKMFFLNVKKVIEFRTPEFLNLSYLAIFGLGLEYFKNINFVYLWLGSYSLQDINFKGYESSKYLRISKCRNLNGSKLSDLVNLRHFRCEWDSSNGDFSGLSKLKKLQAFSAFKVSKMTSLPDFSENINLEVVDIFQCNRLEDLSGLYNAPNLRILTIDESKKIRTEMIEPLVNHPTLEKILIRATVDEIRLQELFGDRWSRDLANMDYVIGEPRF